MRHNDTTGDGLGQLRDELRGIKQRLDELERPSGTNKTNLTAQVQTQLASIDTRVAASVAANSYTQAQIDSKIASPGAISPSTVSASGAISSGAGITASAGVAAGTGISTSAGDITTPASLRGADIYATNAPGYNITGTRVAGWWESATGRGGTATSSQRFKTNITAAGLSDDDRAQIILGLEVVHYNYIAEVARRDDPTSPDYVGPDYQVHTEVGMIAERLHEAGLWEFVIYEREAKTKTRYNEVTDEEGLTTLEPYTVSLGDSLKLDADGNPIPFGIHYEMFALAALAAAQFVNRRYTDLEARIATLEGK